MNKKMEDDLVNELKKFDVERALVAWDSLVVSQQRTLESLGVPCMFVSSSKTDREVRTHMPSNILCLPTQPFLRNSNALLKCLRGFLEQMTYNKEILLGVRTA